MPPPTLGGCRLGLASLGRFLSNELAWWRPKCYSLTRYADLLAQAEFTACSIESSPPVYQTVQEMAGGARQAWTV